RGPRRGGKGRAGALLLRAVLARVFDLAAAAALPDALYRRAGGAVCGAVRAAGRRAGAAAPPLRAARRTLVCSEPAAGHRVLGAPSDPVFYLLCPGLRGLRLGAGQAAPQRRPLPGAGGAGGGPGRPRPAGPPGAAAGPAACRLAAAAAAA